MSASLFLPLPNKKFSIIYSDPPWCYKGQKQHTKAGKPDTGGAIEHYETVKSTDLAQLKVSDIAEKDCLLFMWVTSPHLQQGITLMNSWGFNYATIAFVWDKQKTNPGFYTLSQCEICLVGKRGKIPKPRGQRNIRQLVSSLRGEHSQKPNEVRKRIELMFPSQTKIELFARETVEGWDAWGNQVTANQ